MDKKLLTKTIISCVCGVVLWAIIDFVVCTVKGDDFIDTFFDVVNIIEVVAIMGLAGATYYISRTKKNKNGDK